MGRWSTAYKNRLPDANFLVVKKGGKKDKTGRTKPRRLRKLPIRDARGFVSVSHVKNALGRIAQPHTDLTAAERASAKAKAKALLAQSHILRAVDAELLKPYLHGKRRAA